MGILGPLLLAGLCIEGVSFLFKTQDEQGHLYHSLHHLSFDHYKHHQKYFVIARKSLCDPSNSPRDVSWQTTQVCPNIWSHCRYLTQLHKFDHIPIDQTPFKEEGDLCQEYLFRLIIIDTWLHKGWHALRNERHISPLWYYDHQHHSWQQIKLWLDILALKQNCK